jgi:hypothetical protein
MRHELFVQLRYPFSKEATMSSANSILRDTEVAPKNSHAALGGAILLRTLMKNYPVLREEIVNVLREQIAACGVSLPEETWRYLVFASALELEHSHAHVIE